MPVVRQKLHLSSCADFRNRLYYLIFALLVVAIGLGLFCIAFLPAFKSVNELHDVAQKIGGGFISTLSAFPLKEYLARRDRLRILMALDKRISVLRLEEEVPEEEVRRLTDLIWEIYKKGATA